MVPRYGIYDAGERIDSFTLREIRRP
jgi:hypothetical protein